MYRLSTLLRTSLQHAQRDTIPIKEELTLFENYLQLQQLRFGKALHYEIIMEEKVLSNSQLPIFSLQLLAENAIKHNAFSIENPLALQVRQVDQKLLCVSNNYRPKLQYAPSIGIGLHNLSERFRLLSDVTIQVECCVQDRQFRVYIPVLQS